jgi:hypothetical protein
MQAGEHPNDSERVSFAALRERVGFDAYDEAPRRYASSD